VPIELLIFRVRDDLWVHLGTKPVARSTFTVPLLVVAVAVGIYLRDIPAGGNDSATN
jgi:hypothetical protein